MPKYSIYSMGTVDLKYIVSDLNGTLALDGDIIEGVAERFQALDKLGFEIFVITGDIHGNAEKLFEHYRCKTHVVDITEKHEKQDIQKFNFINQLGAKNVFALGNGANDALMLESAAVGVLIAGQEGGSTLALQKSNIVINSINDALDLLLNPKRIAGH